MPLKHLPPLLVFYGCALCCFVSGCGDAESFGTNLIIISPHRDEIRREVERGFRDWLAQRPEWKGTRVNFVWRDVGGGTSQIERYLNAQYKENPNTCDIDVFFGGGTDPFIRQKENNHFERFPLPAALGAKFRQSLNGVVLRDADDYWFGCTLTTFGILYNREVLDRLGFAGWELREWHDLADPRLYGHVSAGDPRMSGSVLTLYEWVLQSRGWDEGFRLLMKLGANARLFARFSDSVSRDVVMGKAAASGTMDFFALTAIAREERDVKRGMSSRNPLGFVLPSGDTIINADSIAILKGAPNLKLAQAFVEYCLSEEGGQQLWMLEPTSDADLRLRYPGAPHRYRMCRPSVLEALYDPVRYPAAHRSVQIDPFALLRATEGGKPAKQYDTKLGDSRRQAVGDLFGAWIIDPHADLHAAWGAVLKAPADRRAQLERKLFAPPVREEEVRGLDKQVRDPRRRAEFLSQWVDAAQDRYRLILREARR
jgi:ABC-type Fe3+ transport system substrate-binding protein